MAPRLNFDRAEYLGSSTPLGSCSLCGRGLEGEWFRAESHTICAVCARVVREAQPQDNARVFWRTAAWGAAAAVGGSLVLYGMQLALDHLDASFGIVVGAIALGLFIGKVMRWASAGAGGRRYQVTASLLTYAAVAVAMSASIVDMHGVPLYVYPLLVIGPILHLFSAHAVGVWEFVVAGVGIRFAWAQLPAWPVKLEVQTVEGSQ